MYKYSLFDPDKVVEKMEKWSKGAILVLLFLCAVIVGSMVWKIYLLPRPIPETLQERQENKIKKYFKVRHINEKVIGLIEIHYNERMFYEMNGRKCEIK